VCVCLPQRNGFILYVTKCTMIYPMNNGEKPADHLTIGFPCQPGDRFENRNAITKKGGKGGKGGLVDQPGVEDVGFW
jgi:hypothetical protein